MKRMLSAALAAAMIGASVTAHAADKVKVGFISTLSGPNAALGIDIRDAFQLAVKMNGGKLGGLPAEVIVGDDQFNPDTGKQVADRMIKRDRVDFLTGIVFSNILLAVAPAAIEAKTIVISANAGPSQLAGEQCSKYFFSASWQNDVNNGAPGMLATQRDFKNIFLIAPNYPAGRDALNGFKTYYKGKIVDEVYTKLGQVDYQAEISQLRAKNPKAVFVFFPGGMGIQFMRQYSQAGLRNTIPLYSVYTADELSLPAVKDDALGQF